MQLASLWMIFVIAKIRFNVLIWFLNFLMIMSVNVKRVRFILLVICIKLFIILCHFMYLVSFYIKWWILKSFISEYLSNLLSSCCKLYMKKFLLMFCRNSEDSEYMLWMCSIISFSLRVSNERSDLECFIIQNEIEIFLFIKKHAQFWYCHE